MILELNNTDTASSRLDKDIAVLRDIVANALQAYADDETADLYGLLRNEAQDFPAQTVIGKAIPGLSTEEWLIMMLALMPHVKPGFFESIILKQMPSGSNLPEFGGVKTNSHHRGMLPTGETVQFVLAGGHTAKRLQVQQYFREGHFFYRRQVLWLEPVQEGEPIMSGRVVLSQEWVERILLGKESAPRFGLDFPARHIETTMQWEDAVLHPRTMQQIKDISTWLEFHPKLLQDGNLARKIKPGYRVLFYGPPGTGKTLTAALLGRQFNKEVYRVDLSQIVSKYIGETEKNLENVFRKAESKDWILFFDEADALFGKRTNVQSAHDKYANQEVSYLLQRVEDYGGLLILASNFKNNLDEAFIRRFHAVVHFPMPNATERLNLWKKSMPANMTWHESVNLQQLAEQYELSGASILNAVYYATLQVYARSADAIQQNDLLEGIRREFLKEERTF